MIFSIYINANIWDQKKIEKQKTIMNEDVTFKWIHNHNLWDTFNENLYKIKLFTQFWESRK